MSQSGYTPISNYSSSTASAVPLAANLVQGELAINTNDGKLFYKDSAGAVQTIAYKNTPLSTVTGTLPIANGGTNATATPTAGAVPYGTGTAYAFTSAGTAGQVLTSNGSAAPTWSTVSAGSVTSVGVSGGTTGLTTSGGPITSSGTITLAGTLGVANGGTGLTTLTANNVILGNGTSTPSFVAPGTAGNVLKSNGTTWVSLPATGGTSSGRVFFTANLK